VRAKNALAMLAIGDGVMKIVAPQEPGGGIADRWATSPIPCKSAQAASLERATMPNSQRYQDWRKWKDRAEDG
jgi:hypothetical protein